MDSKPFTSHKLQNEINLKRTWSKKDLKITLEIIRLPIGILFSLLPVAVYTNDGKKAGNILWELVNIL